jgi:hypothetical protein
MASLLTELVGIQRAATQGNSTNVPTSPITHDILNRPSTRDIWLNGIWIVSLALTLSTALISGLVKQWFHYYVADATGTPRHRACIRQYRLMGLAKWRVSYLIKFLPVIMNTSLLLFFVGLALFSQDLTGAAGIKIAIAILTCLPFAFYVGTSALPLWDPQCPYKTSLTGVFNLCIKVISIFIDTSYTYGRLLRTAGAALRDKLKQTFRAVRVTPHTSVSLSQIISSTLFSFL